MDAKSRWSPWDLLLIPATAGPYMLFFWLSVVGMGKLIQLIHPDMKFFLLPRTIGGILMLLGIACAWITPSVLLGNLLVLLVPAARRDFKRRFPEVSFSFGVLPGSRRAVHSMCVFALGGVAVAIVGALLPW